MDNKYLIVIDMQEDFVYGPLGSGEAKKIVNAVCDKVKKFDGEVIFTRDTHQSNYLRTQEGRLLPVTHCVEGSAGWELIAPLKALCEKKMCAVYDKPTFGSVPLARALKKENQMEPITSIELVGVCTDICVVSNALLLKAHMPEIPISVDAACCAGTTPEKHQAALETMRSCQIIIK